MSPEITVQTDITMVSVVLAAALLLIALIVLVKLIAKPTFAKFAILGFLGMAMLVGTIVLLSVLSYQSLEYPTTHSMEYPPYVVELPMDQIRDAQQKVRQKQAARRAEQLVKLEETKAELADALAEVAAAKEEARQQLREAQLQAKEATEQAKEIARTATKSAEQQVWQDFAKGLSKGDWKDALKDLGDYLDAMEGIDIDLSSSDDDDDEDEELVVSYDGVGEEVPKWMNQFQGPGQIIPDGESFHTMLFLGPDDDKEQALRASLAECQRWYCSAHEINSDLATSVPMSISRGRLRDCVKETHKTKSRSTGLPVEYLLVEFNEHLTQKMKRHARDVEAAESSVSAGVYSATTLGFVGMLFGFLKFGEWRTGRKS